MPQCNVDFFDINTMECVHHDVIDNPNIDDDRLALSTSGLTISPTSKVSKFNVVHVYGYTEFFGIVSEAPNEKTYETLVYVKPFCALFDHEIMFDTSYQTGGIRAKSYGLESYIGHLIDVYHINTRDDDPKVEIGTLIFHDNITADTSKYTTEWDLGINANGNDSTLSIVNLLTDIMARALSKYAIGIEAKPLFASKQIEITIQKGTESTLIIDADDPAVTIETFYIDSASSEVNKLEIWDTSNQNNVRYYYLYTDKTYGMDKNPSNKERIYPVVTSIKTATSSSDKPFSTAADEVAKSEFNNILWNNLIELSVFKDDPRIKPMDIPIGQQVNIVHNGSIYSSILTGRKLADVVTLCFGTIRVDLTKKLKTK